MKLLIYAFTPYKKHRENISEKVIEKVKPKKSTVKVIFPGDIFEKEMFLKKIRKHKPDVVLGLAQHPRAKRIRIERKAINFKKYNRKDKKEKPKPIYKNKPRYQFLNLKLKKDKNSYFSYNAGMYVCNFSMYVVSEFSEGKGIKFAFLHIPKDYMLSKAVEFVETKIGEVLCGG